MRIFDVLGPVMIGPSSSHTAGAARIGLTARKLLGEEPKNAVIKLHGSFAETGVGHGTDRAIVAGILGFEPDDPRLASSFDCAKDCGLDFTIENIDLQDAYPNTAVINLTGISGRELEIMAESVGGGRIRVCRIDGVNTSFSGETNTLIVHNHDKPGLLNDVTHALASRSINVANMQLYRSAKGKNAVMVLECDQPIPDDVAAYLSASAGITKITRLNMEVK